MPEFPTVNLENLSDNALVAEIVKRNTQAFSIIYDRYSGKLFGLSMKILQDRPLAEDALQEVFLAFWNKAKQFDTQKGNLLAWLIILCRNKCIDKLRSRNNRSLKSTSLDSGDIQPLSEPKRLRPDAMAQHSDYSSLVREALKQLPAEQRTLIEMAYYLGYTQSELAQELGVPLGTVKTRMRRGMIQLRKLIKSFLGEV